MGAKRIVLLDPGHGAETPGKRSPDGTLREYEFNRAAARLAQSKLAACGIDARLTVSNDTDMPLIQRTNQARDLKRQGYEVLLVSIHANAYGTDWNNANGIETFTNDHAGKLAGFVQKHLITATKLTNRGVKKADLHITRESQKHGVPAILVELGFMTNRDECALLKTAGYRETCATALAKAVCEWTGVNFRESTDNSQKTGSTVDKCNIEVNGKLLPVSGILRDGISLLPVRAVAEAAGKGALVGWQERDKKITLNGNVLTGAQVIDGTGYVPARELAAALGLQVEWCGQSKTVKLE